VRNKSGDALIWPPPSRSGVKRPPNTAMHSTGAVACLRLALASAIDGHAVRRTSPSISGSPWLEMLLSLDPHPYQARKKRETVS